MAERAKVQTTGAYCPHCGSQLHRDPGRATRPTFYNGGPLIPVTHRDPTAWFTDPVERWVARIWSRFRPPKAPPPPVSYPPPTAPPVTDPARFAAHASDA